MCKLVFLLKAAAYSICFVFFILLLFDVWSKYQSELTSMGIRFVLVLQGLLEEIFCCYTL